MTVLKNVLLRIEIYQKTIENYIIYVGLFSFGVCIWVGKYFVGNFISFTDYTAIISLCITTIIFLYIYNIYKNFISSAQIYLTDTSIILSHSLIGEKYVFLESIEKVIIARTEIDEVIHPGIKTIFIIVKKGVIIDKLLRQKGELTNILIDHHIDNILPLKERFKRNEVLIIPHCLNHKDIQDILRKKTIEVLWQA